MSEKKSAGTFACGHPMEWSNSYFDANHVINCMTCFREGTTTLVVENLQTEAPAQPAVAPVPAPVVFQEAAAPVQSIEAVSEAPVAAEQPVEAPAVEEMASFKPNIKIPRSKPLKEMTTEEYKDYKRRYANEYNRLKREWIISNHPDREKLESIEAPGGRIRFTAAVKIPRTKALKDMTPEELKDYQRRYANEKNRLKREQRIADHPDREKLEAIEGGKVRMNALIKIPRTKPIKDMTDDERKAYQRAYSREYTRIKREQEGRPARVSKPKVNGTVTKPLEAHPTPEPTVVDDFKISYDRHGVAHWLPGETPQERLKRRKNAEQARLIAKQAAERSKALGKLKTPGAALPVKSSGPTEAELREEKAREYRRRYYQQHKERLQAGMTVAEAKAVGWTPNMAFSHA